MNLRFAAWLAEDNQRTGCKVGLYPPLYTLSQYPDLYYTPIAADYITYHDIEEKSPVKTNPPGKTRFPVVSPNSRGKLKRQSETP